MRKLIWLALLAGCASGPRTLPEWAVITSERVGSTTEGKSVRQSSADLEVLYAQAAVADLELRARTSEVAAATAGVAVFPPGLKGRARAEEKIKEDYAGDASRIFDLTRSTISYRRVADIYHGLDLMAKRVEIVRMKDRFIRPIDNGYRDILVNVRLSNGHIGEIQLHLEQIRLIKEEEHAVYEEVRSIQGRADLEKRALNPAEAAEILKVREAFRARYDAAFQSGLTQ